MTQPKSRADTGLDRSIPEEITGPVPQNPAPMSVLGQVDETRVRTLADQILRVFLNTLPSNYVSTTGGPNYVRQFQAAAEELARIQVLATDTYEDIDYDFTRPESLFQVLGKLVFPDAEHRGAPVLSGDITYREFLKRMVALLLRGSKITTVQEGLSLLTDSLVRVRARVDFIGQPGVAWTTALDQFALDVEVSRIRRTLVTTAMSVVAHSHEVTLDLDGNGVTGPASAGPAHTHAIEGFRVLSAHGTSQGAHTHDLFSEFPELPMVLQQNALLVAEALTPNHTLYDYQNLFREAFRDHIRDEIVEFDVKSYYYDDFRRDCEGFRSFESTGAVLSGRYLFRDPTVSFRAIRAGAPFTVLSGPNQGTYEVAEVRHFPFGDDPVARAYTTSPTNLSGTATVAGNTIRDSAQNFSSVVAGETLTFATGPNAGTYLIENLLGGSSSPPTSVSVHPSILRTTRRFPQVLTGVSYRVEVDRLGSQTVQQVTGEDVSSQFYSPGGPFDTILVAHGPLAAKDGRPAGPADVVVTVAGTPVAVQSVDSAYGQITLTTPVAGSIPGAVTILVTYRWLHGQVQGLRLGRRGLTLGRWDMRGGYALSPSPSSMMPGGAVQTSRFRMGVVLGSSYLRSQPVRVAHRFIGFEDSYTSALGNPRTLRLGRAPGRASSPYATAVVAPTALEYVATETPPFPWAQVGAGTSSVSQGELLLQPEVGSVLYWKNDLPLPTGSVVAVGSRMTIPSTGTLDGVFTGVGVGFHDNHRLYFAGALVVTNPVTHTTLRHLGILARPGDLSEVTSWVLGPSATGQVEGLPGTNVLTVPATNVPTLLAAGDKFQVLMGGQAGVYTITDLFRSDVTGDVTLLTEPAFPADPGILGNRDVEVLFEARWDVGPSTWRLYANTREESLQVVFGGSSGGTMTVGARPLAVPASLGPDILPEGTGRLLWGSISRQARCESRWNFVRAQAAPENRLPATREVLVDTVLTGDQDPEKDGVWYGLTPFGDTFSSGGRVRLTATPALGDLGTTYGYGYTSPFLNGKRVTTLEAKLRVSRDTDGQGAAVLQIQDTHRVARISNLIYRDDGTTRQIYNNGAASLVGIVPYTQQDVWSSTGSPRLFANGRDMILRGDMAGGAWSVSCPYSSSFIEFRLAVSSFTAGTTNRIGLAVTTIFGGKTLVLDLVSPNLVAIRGAVTTSPVASAVIPWADGQPRTFRLEYDNSGSVTLFVDNVSTGVTVSTGSFPATSFPGTGITAIPETGSAFEAVMDSLTVGPTTTGVTGLDRTFGIWLGGDPTDIDQWVIPRTDATGAPNSDAVNAVPVSMDWRSECWVRAFMDPTFGVSLIRPDLAPPPGYTGDFATQSMNPSAGWAVLEYARLPRVTGENYGSVAFGSLNPATSSISTWGDIHHRVFSNTSTDYTMPTRMTLGRRNVITSGDFLKDVSPETVIVASDTRTTVPLRPCGITADRVFQVVVDDVVVTHDEWTFDARTQVVSLVYPLPAVGYPVTVVFAVGQPVTTTYLQTQPWRESQTVLNEGTPPFSRGQVGQGTITTISASGETTPVFPPAGPSNPNYFLRDPYLAVAFENPAEDVRYRSLSFYELEDGGTRGAIAHFCDHGGPVEMGVSGAFYEEHFGSIGTILPGGWPGVLFAGGGSIQDTGLIGPAVYVGPYTGPDQAPSGLYPAMIQPTGPSEGVVPGSEVSSPYRETFMALEIPPTAPMVQDTVPAPTDQNYASMGPIEMSPSVVGSAQGSAWYQLVTQGDYSRPGPWTGYEPDLAVMSLLYGASTLQPTGVPDSGNGFTTLGGSPLPDGPTPLVGVL